MKKSKQSKTPPNPVKDFAADLDLLLKIPIKSSHKKLILPESPFDGQLLTLSPLYRHSRKMYLSLGGQFSPKVISVMRSLSTQDLFKDLILYSPILSEIEWFAKSHEEIFDQKLAMDSILNFSAGSLYHEQNHRILWRLLPPCPEDADDVRRYLNFSESLVVALDLALGNELGFEISEAFGRTRSIFRPGSKKHLHKKTKAQYREYLHVLWVGTYLLLEHCLPADVPKALNYIFPGKKALIKMAMPQILDLSSMFIMNTNPEWQRQNWKASQKKLAILKKNSKEDPLYMAIDPLDMEEEFVIANRIFDIYGL